MIQRISLVEKKKLFLKINNWKLIVSPKKSTIFYGFYNNFTKVKVKLNELKMLLK